MKSEKTKSKIVSINSIEAKANRLLGDYYGNRLPIKVERIAQLLRVEVLEKDDLGDGITGVLVVNKGKGVIGYSRKENRSEERKRYSDS